MNGDLDRAARMGRFVGIGICLILFGYIGWHLFRYVH